MSKEREIHCSARAFKRIDGEEGHIVVDDDSIFVAVPLGRDFEVQRMDDNDQVKNKYKEMLNEK